MRPHSALARLQQFTTLGALALATAWLLWHWDTSRAWALAGFLGIAFAYSIFLALEFVALHYVPGGADVPRPTWSELVRAWAGETMMAPRVFCWRQPFRWRAVPDQPQASPAGQRGVVLIHGFVCNRGFWTPWLARLRAAGHPFIAVNLEPVFGSIEDYVVIVEEAVAQLTQTTGMPPVLVCHSMGGLAARAWLRTEGAPARVHHVFTIGSPHNGTWLGQFSHLKNGRQMRLDGDWVRDLTRQSAAAVGAKFTCWYSNCDNIVFPAATATLPGADNRLVRGVAHVELAFHPVVMDATLASISASC